MTTTHTPAGRASSTKTKARIEHAYAIVRVDEFLGPDVPVRDKVTVKKVMWDADAAEEEATRLNSLQPGGDVYYFVQTTRVEQLLPEGDEPADSDDNLPPTQEPGDAVSLLPSVRKRPISIPTSELAPGMVRIRIIGQHDEVWTHADELRKGVKEGPVQHPRLKGAIRAMALEPFETFAPLGVLSWCRTTEKWVDGFRHDLNAWREILVWLRLSRVFKTLTAGRQLTTEQKADIYAVLQQCVNAGDAKKVRHLTNPRTLSKKRVIEIAELWYSGRYADLVTDAEYEALAEYAHKRAKAIWPELPEKLREVLEVPGLDETLGDHDSEPHADPS